MNTSYYNLYNLVIFLHIHVHVYLLDHWISYVYSQPWLTTTSISNLKGRVKLLERDASGGTNPLILPLELFLLCSDREGDSLLVSKSPRINGGRERSWSPVSMMKASSVVNTGWAIIRKTWKKNDRQEIVVFCWRYTDSLHVHNYTANVKLSIINYTNVSTGDSKKKTP